MRPEDLNPPTNSDSLERHYRMPCIPHGFWPRYSLRTQGWRNPLPLHPFPCPLSALSLLSAPLPPLSLPFLMPSPSCPSPPYHYMSRPFSYYPYHCPTPRPPSSMSFSTLPFLPSTSPVSTLSLSPFSPNLLLPLFVSLSLTLPFSLPLSLTLFLTLSFSLTLALPLFSLFLSLINNA